MCWSQKVVTRWRRERTSSAAPPRKTNDDDMFAAASTSLSTTYSACFRRRRRQEQQQVSSDVSSTRKTNLRIRASSSSSSSNEPAKIQETYQFHSPGKVTFAHETEEEQSKWTNCGISHVGDVNEDAKVKLGVVIGTSFCALSTPLSLSLSLRKAKKEAHTRSSFLTASPLP